jgi:hypothetical protein
MAVEAVIATAFVAGRVSRRTAVGTLVAFSAVAFSILAYLRFDIAAMYRDLLLVSHARDSEPYIQAFINTMPVRAIHMMVFLVVALLAWRVRAATYDLLRFRSVAGLIVAVVATGSLLELTNTQAYFAAPLLAPAAVIVMSWAVPFTPLDHSDLRPVMVVVLGGMLIAYWSGKDVYRFAYAAWMEAAGYEVPVRFDTPRADGLFIHQLEGADDKNSNYIKRVNDGLKLLRRYSQPNETIMTFEFSNPFSYLLERRPAKHIPAWWHAEMTFSSTAPLPANVVFEDVSIVMFPIDVPRPQTATSLLEDLYGVELRQRYAVAARSEHWLMFRKKT